MKQIVKKVVGRVLSAGPQALQTRFKETNEMLYWRLQKFRSGAELYNGHMAYFFTSLFGLDRDYYNGKRILDVGCGPIGTLEWADDALERVGLDPLADKYVKLTAGKHKMRYVKSGCESIPFADGHFDIVTTFNSLDHVENVDAAIVELTRVLRPGGDMLIIVEINHEPTITEPHTLSEDFGEKFKGLDVVSRGICAIRDDHDVYASLLDPKPPASADDEAILWLHLRKA